MFCANEPPVSKPPIRLLAVELFIATQYLDELDTYATE